MAMVMTVAYTGELPAQVDWFGPKVGGHWRCMFPH